MFRVLTCLTTEHDWRLVVLAGAVCFLSSFAAIGLLQRARASQDRARLNWFVTAGIATGCGIWATHFIAMLAYDPGAPAAYDIALTALSLLAAIAVTTAGLGVAVYVPQAWGSAAGGALVGTGVAFMHYLGMFALEVPGQLIWEPLLVAASVLFGIAFAMAALTIAVRDDRAVTTILAAALLTLAIVAHHFIAMGAAAILPDPALTVDTLSLSPAWLAMAIAAAVWSILGMCLVAALLDRRTKLLISGRNQLLNAALNNMGRGLCMFDAEARVALYNARFLEIYRLSPDVVRLGSGVLDVLRARQASGTFDGDPEAYVEKVRADLAEGKTVSRTYECRDGRTIVVYNEPMPDGGWVSTHEDITEIKRREASFRLLFKSNPLPMYVYELDSLKFLAVNDAAIAHYGHTREQFLAMTLPDMRAPEDRERFIRSIKAVGGNYQAEETWRHRKADGTLFETEVYSRQLNYEGHVAALAVVLDVTERKHAEGELRRTREFLNTIIDNVPVSVTVKTADDLRYVLINRACEEFFGKPREDIIGKTVNELFPPVVADAVAARDRESLANGRLAVFDATIRAMPGGDRVINTRKVVIRDNLGRPQYLLGVVEDITERKRAEAQIAYMAQHDALTDLPNRTSFVNHLNATLERAAAVGEKFAVMSIDLDRFKEVNDVFGHAIGDALLRAVSRRLQEVAAGAFLARLGGDEFALVATAGAKPEATEALAERLLSAAADEFDIEGRKLRIGLSIGVAIYPSDGVGATALLGNADAALYRAKAEGRGMIRFFDADTDQRLRDRRALQHDLQGAIERGELVLHYQPQARVGGDVIGFEALVRWQHPTRGMIPPNTFIPIAEESGLIIPLGEWILRQACREAASWPRPLQLAINLSPVQFRHGDLPGLVHAVLLETGLSPSRLELEITEGVLIGDFARAVSILRRLKTLGVRIAMDDFGTGYSSLSYLQSFPFDKIKIDRAFIANLDNNAQSAAIVRAVIGLGHGLGLPVVAEGVETQAQLAILAADSCDEYQGYLVGGPRPIEDYAGMVGRKPAGRKPKLALAS